MNRTGNREGISANSVPQYELVSYRGEIFGPYDTIQQVAGAAKLKWPDQEQDEDRTAAGWDVQVVHPSNK